MSQFPLDFCFLPLEEKFWTAKENQQRRSHILWGTEQGRLMIRLVMGCWASLPSCIK